MMTLRCVLLAIVGLVASADSLFAQTPPAASPAPVPPPATEAPNGVAPTGEPRTGDRWTYELRDDITGDIKSTIVNTVTDVSDTDVSMRVTFLGNPISSYQTYDRSWDLTNDGLWRFTPNDGTGIRVPLAVGTTWSFAATDLNSTAGVSWRRTGTSNVVAQESLTTRAGTFDTFRIETSIQFQNVTDPTTKLQAEQQIWYAPAIDHWVRRTFVSRLDGRVRDKSSTELVEYGRN
jgi:hypothetical protein